MNLQPSDVERFWAKVDKSGGDDVCWPWMAYKDEYGYGRFGLHGTPIRAHRIAFFLSTDSVAEEVCHHCDNPACVNPNHLFGGTHTDNMADKATKGRQFAKLTEATVREIRRLHAAGAGYTQKILGEMFGVNRSQIRRIVNRVNWRHV